MEWLGSRPHAEVQDLLGEAVLILPSTWYEGFPKILVRRPRGRPWPAAGAMAELIDDGPRACSSSLPTRKTGGESAARWDPCRRAAMRQSARKCFEDNHTAERNYRQLVAIYYQVLAPIQAGARRPENLPLCLPSKPSDPCGGYESTR